MRHCSKRTRRTETARPARAENQSTWTRGDETMSNRREMLQREYHNRRAKYVDRPTPPGQNATGGLVVRRRRKWPWAVLVMLILSAIGFVVRVQNGKGVVQSLTEVASPVIADASGLSEEDVAALLTFLLPPESEMRQIYQFTVNSPYVQENSQYAQIVNEIPFVYDEEDNEVNAYAGGEQVETQNGVELKRKMVLDGGLVRYSRVLGLAAAMEATHPGILKHTVESMPVSLLGKSSVEATGKFAIQQGLYPALSDESARNRARSFSSGMLMEALAHEMGRYALGHLDFNSQVSDEIRRNQEMQADSFASAITQLSATSSEDMRMAQMLLWYALAMQNGEEHGDLSSGDHPLSRWRLERLIRQNDELATALGILDVLTASLELLQD